MYGFLALPCPQLQFFLSSSQGQMLHRALIAPDTVLCDHEVFAVELAALTSRLNGQRDNDDHRTARRILWVWEWTQHCMVAKTQQEPKWPTVAAVTCNVRIGSSIHSPSCSFTLVQKLHNTSIMLSKLNTRLGFRSRACPVCFPAGNYLYVGAAEGTASLVSVLFGCSRLLLPFCSSQ